MEQITVTVGGQILVANAREFKTGSRGFYGSGKVTLANGKRYQVSVNVVEIGSKPANGQHAPAPADTEADPA